MNNVVLLVVDVQTALVQSHPYNEQAVIRNIKRLIADCRAKGIEVIYIRHDGGVGDELERGTGTWQVYSEIAPEKEDKIFEKEYNSAFLHTGLKDYLDSKKIKNIILVGMQTEYCIDATCKAALEHGYQVIIPEETNTTFGNEYLTGEQLYNYYNFKIWNNRFARVLPIQELELKLS